MLEVIILVLLVLAILVFFFFLFRKDDYASKVFESEKNLAFEKSKLGIAERKFLQGKIKREVFSPLIEELESEVTEKELELFELKKKNDVLDKTKFDLLAKKLSKPNRFRKAKLEKLLKESEVLRSELGLLEVKLMKREIKESVFQKLVKKVEKKLIEKESEIIKVLN